MFPMKPLRCLSQTECGKIPSWARVLGWSSRASGIDGECKPAARSSGPEVLPRLSDVSQLLLSIPFGPPVVTDVLCTAHEFARHDPGYSAGLGVDPAGGAPGGLTPIVLPRIPQIYINQLEMGLRFPIPRFITTLCKHIKVSPTQLSPNSYSFLLLLVILLSYFDIPLIPYVLIQLIQVKRLGPGKFYLSHKGDLGFIRGNPSSHKGWMNHFFYINRAGRKRNPWRCNMSWRDNVYILTPSTPDRAPHLTPFLTAMRGKSYSAPKMIKEDLLCHFGFSMNGVRLVGDLVERMGKAVMLKAFKERPEEGSSGKVSPPSTKKGKRKASQSFKKEARSPKKKEASTSLAQIAPTNDMCQASTSPSLMQQERPAPTPPSPAQGERPAPTSPARAAAIPEVPLSKARARTKVGSGRAATLNIFGASLVVSPSRSVVMGLLYNLVPDRDLNLVRNAPDVEAVGAFATLFATGKKLTTERAELVVDKEALVAEKKAVEAKLEALTTEKFAVEVELDETRVQAEGEN
ncbi:hypothetical protein F511_15449 [Dorcoceras hygrometricum]|uniref:Uncharacterized protein n=1 Tax=Dorcoceras hygrometricum TaxID=472368 RepID=A0A2Z7CY51_9LAMI|nr:hypothetical protein F511_15449 [Dorcoceras hygrometricum]